MSSAEMNKRSSSPRPEAQTTTTTTMVDFDSAAIEFKVNYEETRHLAPGKAIHSDPISTGGHMWRINWYPRGRVSDNYLAILSGMSSMMVELMSKSQSASATAIIHAAVTMEETTISMGPILRGPILHVFRSSSEFGWPSALEQTRIRDYVTDDGQITFFFSIMVFRDRSIIVPAPPSDIREHLGALLDSTDGADVAFVVDGETFHAHRAVLAARSPVFRAELLGSMSEATMSSSITLHDIAPAAFRIMLRFMYTDTFPGDDELGESRTELFMHLLAAADRYALDRLKIMCVQQLWDSVSVHTVGDVLACAEIYNCPELKSKCIGFVVSDENFKKAVLTKSFMQLGLKFPSIIDEVLERVDA